MTGDTPRTPAPSQTAVEPVAMWAYRDSFSKPDEWDVTFDAKEAQAITEAVAAGEEGYACEPLIFASTLTAQAAALVAAEARANAAYNEGYRARDAVVDACRARADAAESELATLKARIAGLEAGLEDVFRLNDECSGAEPSVSVLMRAIDRAREALPTFKAKPENHE